MGGQKKCFLEDALSGVNTPAQNHKVIAQLLGQKTRVNSTKECLPLAEQTQTWKAAIYAQAAADTFGLIQVSCVAQNDVLSTQTGLVGNSGGAKTRSRSRLHSLTDPNMSKHQVQRVSSVRVTLWKTAACLENKTYTRLIKYKTTILFIYFSFYLFRTWIIDRLLVHLHLKPALTWSSQPLNRFRAQDTGCHRYQPIKTFF